MKLSLDALKQKAEFITEQEVLSLITGGLMMSYHHSYDCDGNPVPDGMGCNDNSPLK